MTSTAGWPEVGLGEVCEFRYGKSLPAGQREPGAYSVYGSNGVVGQHTEALTNGPTIIIGRKGSFGEVNYSDTACWPIDTTYFVDASSTEADLRWLAHLLPTLRLTELNRAAAIPGLNRDDAYRRRCVLPPFDEQRRIAAILDQADALRAKRRDALAHLDDLTQSIFLDMFGVDASVWPTEAIAKACDLVVDCVNRTAPIVDGPTPYKMIRTSNVKNGQVDLSNVRFVEEDVFLRWNRRATPSPGDVLLTREAPVGQSGILDTDEQVFLGQRLMLYRVNHEKLTPEYLLATFNEQFLQEQFDRAGSGSTVKHLPLPACRSFDVPLPPVELQREFTTRVHKLKTLKNRHREQLARFDALFTSLQSRAFTGEL